MHARPLLIDKPFPQVPNMPTRRSKRDAAVWVKQHAGAIRELVNRAGVVLIRGFDVSTPDAFRAVCEAIEPELRLYTGGDSPRTGIADSVGIDDVGGRRHRGLLRRPIGGGLGGGVAGEADRAWLAIRPGQPHDYSSR